MYTIVVAVVISRVWNTKESVEFRASIYHRRLQFVHQCLGVNFIVPIVMVSGSSFRVGLECAAQLNEKQQNTQAQPPTQTGQTLTPVREGPSNVLVQSDAATAHPSASNHCFSPAHHVHHILPICTKATIAKWMTDYVSEYEDNHITSKAVPKFHPYFR